MSENKEKIKKQKNNQLTIKQEKFINYYIETGNATESAIKAGYSKKTAKQIGSENLSKLDYYIKEKMKNFETSSVATQQDVLEFLTRVMNGTEKDSFGLDASLQDRIKSAELIGKRYGTFVEKKDLKVDTEIKVSLDD